MRRLYTFFLYIFVPFIIIRLVIKSRNNVAYRKRILERFSLGDTKKIKADIWVHAVSLGEIIAATPLIEKLLSDGKKVIVTTMTPSGLSQIEKNFNGRVYSQYVPYDLPWCIKRFFKNIDVKVGVIMETELWPNLIYFASKSKIKLVMVNARISDKAFTQYIKLKLFFKPILNLFTFIGAQSELDANRFKSLGASEKIVSCIGNIKFDMVQSEKNIKDFSDFKNAWGVDRIVFIAASTHDNEEQQLLSRIKHLKKAIPSIILLIAPRHKERFKAVYEMCKNTGLKTALRSSTASINESVDVVVIDSYGELMSFYNLSDYAFVGGSLVPIGGHNVLEPISLEIPVLCGPYMQNSKSICDELENKSAIILAKNVDDLIDKLLKLYKNPKERKLQITNALSVLKSNQGTLAKYLAKIILVLSAQH